MFLGNYFNAGQYPTMTVCIAYYNGDWHLFYYVIFIAIKKFQTYLACQYASVNLLVLLKKGRAPQSGCQRIIVVVACDYLNKLLQPRQL